MQIIYVSNSEETRNLVREVLCTQNILKEQKSISSDEIFSIPDNEIILITDELSHFRYIEDSSYSVKNVIKVFLANISNDPFLLDLISKKEKLMLSYKARDLANTIKVLSEFQKYPNASNLILNISTYDYPPTSKARKKISGSLKDITKNAINYINQFINDNELKKVLDKDNVIIASSEIIDNIIELYINKEITAGDIEIEIQLSKNLFSVVISDFFGEADISSISRSISTSLKNGKLFEEELQRGRGRGYTIIRKTTDRIVTLIVRHDAYYKYLFNHPQTSVNILYYLNRKMQDERLNTVIELG